MKSIIFVLIGLLTIQAHAQTFVAPTSSPGNCMRDANDPLVGNSREDLKRAVFKFFSYGSCTGTLINRNASENDLGQYFITSWHCFKSGTTCGGNEYNFNTSIQFIFNYQAPPNHLGQVVAGNQSGGFYTITRPVRLVEHINCGYGDVAVCEILGEPIPAHFNPYFAGWTPAIPPTASSYISFGHSNGSIKQAAATNLIQDGVTLNIQTQSCQMVTKTIDFLLGWIWKHRFSTSLVCTYTQVPFADSRFYVYGYTYGNTNVGASGSALFYAGNRIVGNLSGTISQGCSNTTDAYGKFYTHYSNTKIKNALNPSNKWAVDITGIPGRNKNCYAVIDYNDGNAYNLYPAKYYQAQNAITLNSGSYVYLGKNVSNQMVVKSESDFTFNAATYVRLGPNFKVESGATFVARAGVPCTASGSYRTSEEDGYEEAAKREAYASINSIVIPERMELPAYLTNMQLNVQVFPNPASDVIHVNLFSVPAEKIHVKIYTMFGKEVYANTFDYSNQKELRIPVSSLSDGLYEISFTAGNYKKTEKLVVQK